MTERIYNSAEIARIVHVTRKKVEVWMVQGTLRTVRLYESTESQVAALCRQLGIDPEWPGTAAG